MAERKSPSVTVAFTVVGIVGLLVFIFLWQSAFPEAGVEVNLTEKDAREKAAAFLRSRGYDLTNYDSAVTFGVEQTTAAYLERTLDSDTASRVTRETVPVWQWLGRWFKSQRVEEFQVGLDPADGRLVSFQHIVPEDAPGASITKEQGMQVAVQFLESQGVNLDDYELIAQSSERRATRMDHNFAWQHRRLQIGNAIYKVEVTVQGDQVGRYTQHLVVPESFARSFANEQQTGQLLTVLALFLIFILSAATVVLAAQLLRRDALPWRFGLPFGISLVVGAIIGAINGIPLRWYEYPTQISPIVYMILPVAAAAVMSTILAFFNAMGAAVGYALRPDVLGQSSWLDQDARSRSILERVGRASMPGYALACAYLGFMTLFYLLGRRFLGVWVPSHAGPASMLSMFLPAAAPLLVALQATLLEEIGRFFCIVVFIKYLRSTFVAVALSAVAWALLHSGHAVFPIYVRLFELTVVGIAFGYFFLRFGLVAVMSAHFTVDVVIMALPLLTSSRPYYLGSGIAALLVTALPLILGLVSLWRKSAARLEPSSSKDLVKVKGLVQNGGEFKR